VGIRAACALIAGSVLTLCSAAPCAAETLPGRYEISVGGHYLLHHTERCTTDFDTDEKQCGEDWPFVGFDLAGQVQLGAWFALGARISGSAYIDREEPIGFFKVDRNLWLWSATLEARFDPPIWPRALWLGAELGAVLAMASIEVTNSKRQPDEERSVVGALAGIAVGWDFWLSAPVLLGVQARLQARTLDGLRDASNPTRQFNVQLFPYVSIGLHAGYRW
jgi:hypothetical protein